MEVIPDFSITRESPSQKHIMPASPITMSIDTEAEWKSDFTASAIAEEIARRLRPDLAKLLK